MTLLLWWTAVSAQQSDYGLHINSYPSPAQEHTTLLLDDGVPFDFKGKRLTVSFDLRLRPENILGTVVRIITDNGSNIDLLFSIEDDERFPNLVVGDKANLQTAVPPRGEWVPVSLMADPKNGIAELTYNGVITKVAYPELRGAERARIVMGRSNIEGYTLDDVASVDVRNVTLKRDGKTLRRWNLRGHNDDVCYDEMHHSPATALNPRWIIDDNARWRGIREMKFNSLPSVAFDPVIASFYVGVHNDDRLIVYHSTEGVADTIVVNGSNQLSRYPNQLMYISPLHTVLSYSIDDDRFALFDAIDQKWVRSGIAEKEHDFWNNSVSYNPSDSTLVSFGGYGHYKYNNLLIKAFPFSCRDQKVISLSAIHPRRSCSTVIVGDDLYIFGGRGCPSGRQELGTRNYYDLYRVNLTDGSVDLLWNLGSSPFDSDFTGLENMIYDAISDSFLVLSTLDGGTLLRVNRADGKMEKMSYPIGFDVNAHLVYGNLYFSPEQKRYYASIVTSDTDETTELNFYDLQAPAVAISSLMQTPDIPSESGWMWWISLSAAAMAAVIAAVVFLWRRRKRRHAVSPMRKEEHEGTELPVHADIEEPAPTGNEHPAHSDCHYDLTRGAVRLLGHFQVFDKDGKDITSSFTPTLQQLLILLILYTAKNPRGIAGQKLLDALWGDKGEEAAKNNRNVYISRLRNILLQIGDVSINAQNGFRNIRFGEGTVCDYLEVKSLMKENDPESLNRLLELLYNGMMLPNVEFEYVDSFKSEFSNEAIEVLTGMLRDSRISDKDKVKIADTIFQHDVINEEALSVKCRTLHSQGRSGLAQNVYSAFCREYKALMGEDYPHSFNDVLGS